MKKNRKEREAKGLKRGHDPGFQILLLLERIRRKQGRPIIEAQKIQDWQRLHPGENARSGIFIERRRQINQLILVVLTGTCLIALAGWRLTSLVRMTSIERPGVEEMEEDRELLVDTGEEQMRISVTISPRKRTSEECRRLLEEAYQEIMDDIGGVERGLPQVTTFVNLPVEACGGQVKADWTSQNRDLIDDWGSVNEEAGRLPEEGIDCTFRLLLRCDEEEQEYLVPMTILPKTLSEEEAITEALNELLSAQKETASIRLPERFEEKTISWYEEKQNDTVALLFLVMVIVSVMILISGSQSRQKKEKKRERQLLMDYPRILSEFTVLTQAGVAPRNIWPMMIAAYEKQKREMHYAYEEMKQLRIQLQNGRTEAEAYQSFGERCSLNEYRRFTTLLEQNLKQGTTGLARKLQEENLAALEERKNLAKRLGEEAETKLLIPMFLMLVVVFAVIMIPAFLSF